MKFKQSEPFSVGVELEIQIINPDNYDLIPVANNFLHLVLGSNFEKNIRPEITQSMLEINSSPHISVHELKNELIEIRDYMVKKAQHLNVYLAGGGSHPFQLWNKRKIFQDQKFERAALKYGYLAKQFTVFGLHIHVGCRTPEDMLYLTHSISRYVPQLIALSASSPFCQGIDTDFDSSRSNVVSAFPLHGISPIITNWEEFNAYINSLKDMAIIDTIDNLYWDIRPRPEFGTVEIRVCDMPLSIEKVTHLTAYIQTLTCFLLSEKPDLPINYNNAHLYQHNKFQASHYGLEGNYIDPYTLRTINIKQDILHTYMQINPYIGHFGNQRYISDFMENVRIEGNDAKLIRNVYRSNDDLTDIIRFQIQQFMEIDCLPIPVYHENLTTRLVTES